MHVRQADSQKMMDSIWRKRGLERTKAPRRTIVRGVKPFLGILSMMKDLEFGLLVRKSKGLRTPPPID